jgi:porin
VALRYLQPRQLALALALFSLPAVARGQSAPGSAGQVAPAAPPAQQTQTNQPGAQPTGSAAESIWNQDSLTGDWGGLRKTLLADGITPALEEQSEVWDNLTGGFRQGSAYDGLTTASVRLDLAKLAGWSGASFFVSGYQIHGQGPSLLQIGNNQLVSNIEATPDTKLYDLWLEQSLLNGNLVIRLGQEGASDQMMITQYGALYLNSSFGYPALIVANLPDGGPNYPLAAPFVRVQYAPSSRVTLVGAVFSGDPAPAGPGDPDLRDKGGIAFNLHDHALAFAELWYASNQGQHDKGLPATYKLGAWFDSAHLNDRLVDSAGVSLASPPSNGIPHSNAGAWGFYGIVDQLLWQKPGAAKGHGIGAFLLVMGSPSGGSLSNLSVEGGFNWIAPFAGRDNDTLGLAATYLQISPAVRQYGRELVTYTGTGFRYAGNETVLELTYLAQVTPWLALQPDMQVVFNPNAGIPSPLSAVPLKNDVVVGIHATVTF